MLNSHNRANCYIDFFVVELSPSGFAISFFKFMTVVVRMNDVDHALRRLRKTMQERDVFAILRAKEGYMKPSEKRRVQQKESKMRAKRRLSLRDRY